MSKQQLEKRFRELQVLKESSLMNQPRVFQELVMFMQYKLRNHFKSFSLFNLCGSQRTNFMVDAHLESTFNNLSKEEQLDLYEKTINCAVNFQNMNHQSEVDVNFQDDSDHANDKKEPKRFKVEVEEGFHSWQQIYLTIEGFKVSSTDIHFDIRNYLLRKSKKKDIECYVLQAIKLTKPNILRFCFLTNQDLKKYLPLIKELIDIGYKEEIKRMYQIQTPKASKIKKRSPKKQKVEKPSTEDSVKDKKNDEPVINLNKLRLTLVPEQQNVKNQSRIIEEFIKQPEEQNISLQLNEFVENENEKYQQLEAQTRKNFRSKQLWYKNIFNVIFPQYNLGDIDQFDHFKVASSNQQAGCFVFQHLQIPKQFKLQVVLSLPPQVTLLALTNPGLFKNWHPEIVQAQIKLSISSQNSAIFYQKHKQYSKWYRERDFVYLRHVFKMGQDYYIADKSIQNINFVPFPTIERGCMSYQISKISPSPSGSKLVIQCLIDHSGLLNQDYGFELTKRYLQGFAKMEGYFSTKEFENKLKPFFEHNWTIRMMDNTSSFYQKDKLMITESVMFEQNVVSEINDSDVFFSIKDEEQDKISVHQIQEDQLPVYRPKPVNIEGEEVIRLNDEGQIILPNQYIKVRHPTDIIESAADRKQKPEFDDIVLGNLWGITKDGGLILANQKIKQVQDSVLSHLMSTFKKNLFTKGSLSISLPVTVFSDSSQLMMYATGMKGAPLFLEEAAKMSDPIERMKRVMMTGFTNSLFFIDIQKPFNPILGETYQSYIAGCPFYAEQISHHPPISSILFLGRGYKIHATLEATVHIHMNSADGVNQGWYHVIFDDGQEICFQTPPAEFSGFTFGDRKFNFKDKGFYFDQGNNLFAEMIFEDQSGFMSSNKWKFKDQVEGQIYTVKNQFLHKFISDFPNKKHKLGSKDILQKHNKLSGRWPLSIEFDDGTKYTPNNDLPYENVPYQYPLNSNSTYREDLYYKRINDMSQGQSFKQKLQNIQRADRKFRQKWGKKK